MIPSDDITSKGKHEDYTYTVEQYIGYGFWSLRSHQQCCVLNGKYNFIGLTFMQMFTTLYCCLFYTDVLLKVNLVKHHSKEWKIIWMATFSNNSRQQCFLTNKEWLKPVDNLITSDHVKLEEITSLALQKHSYLLTSNKE